MKRLLVFLFMAIVAVMPLMAVTIDVGALGGIDPLYFTSFAGLVAVILPVTSIVNNLFNTAKKWKQSVSWAVAVLLGVVPYWFDWGIFAGVDWYVALIYSLAAGLVANGLFDITLIKEILKALGLEPDKKPKPLY